jgi:hypothetical protein
MMIHSLLGSILIAVLSLISMVLPNYVENLHGTQHYENMTTSSETLPQKPNQTKIVIVTNVENNCRPSLMCGDVRAEDFQVQIFEFRGEKQLPLELIKSFPGSSHGWTVTLFPHSMQYEVKQLNPILGSNVTVDSSYSNGCHGMVHSLEALCVITTELTNTPQGNISDSTKLGS